ncbi:recombination regulator RecX [Clostridium sp. LBM24168]
MCRNVVTGIKLKSKDRVYVYVDNEFSFSCSTETIYNYNITKGKCINMDYLKSVIEEDNYIKCKNQALRIIERNYRTEKQVCDKLVKKDYDVDTIKRTLKFLRKYKFIDDYKFAKMYIDQKIERFGKNKIKYDLIKKGIGENIIEEELKTIDKSQYEKDAFELALKKYNIMVKEHTDMSYIYRKLGNYMINNGYDMQLTKNILGKVIKKEDFRLKENIYRKDMDALYSTAKKRYNIIARSENDTDKISRKLGQYLLRRNYLWEDIKPVLRKILNKNLED